VTVPGLTLPPELVAQLQDALGGDVRAENELLRDQLQQVRLTAMNLQAVIHDVLTQVDDALSLRPASVQVTPSGKRKPQPGDKGYRLGVLNLNRLECLREHRDELPDPVTAEDAHRVLTENGFHLSLSAAGSVLWRLSFNLIAFQRTGKGEYRWTE